MNTSSLSLHYFKALLITWHGIGADYETFCFIIFFEFGCQHISDKLHDRLFSFSGQFFVWVHSKKDFDEDRGPELHRVSKHARLYSQLLGRVSSATKRMDGRILSIVDSILKEGHSKQSFDFKGLIQWSFIERLRATGSTEAMKLVQSFTGSASNRMRVIVGTYDLSSVEIEYVVAGLNHFFDKSLSPYSSINFN